jgi:hypothetical protein
MADERQTNNPGRSGEGRSGGRKEGRGFLSRKKRGRKSSGEAKAAGGTPAAPKSTPPKSTAPKSAAPKSAASKPAAQNDAAAQERRERRRRRRVRSRQQRGQEGSRDSGRESRQGGKNAPNDLLDMGDTTLKPVFIYTHVLRPAVREAFESRSEHFSKVTRKLEDFNIDLEPLFAERTETSPAGALAPLRPLSDFDYLDDEEYDEEYDEYDELDYGEEVVEGNLSGEASREFDEMEELNAEADANSAGDPRAQWPNEMPHKDIRQNYDKENEE